MGFNSGFKGLIKLEFSRQILEKYSNIKFPDSPSSGSRVVPRRRTDRHDEANSRFPKVCPNNRSYPL